MNTKLIIAVPFVLWMPCVIFSGCTLDVYDEGQAAGRPFDTLADNEQVLYSTIDSVMPHLLREHDIPGAAIVLIEDGKAAWSKGYGYANLDTKRKMTPQTVINVGSISKTVTAWAVMRLVEQGKVELDDPISRHIRKWKLPPGDFDASGVTIRRLLNHTAGISQHGVDFVALDAPLPTLPEALGTAEQGAGVRLVAEPGTAWRYSGGGTTLLQLMIEEVTGTPYAEFVHENIFEPLGMQSSGFNWPAELLRRAAQPYAGNGRTAAYQKFAAAGAAGLSTTAHDLANFAAAALGGNAPVGRGILSPATVDSMWRQAVPVTEPKWPNSRSGLGYFVDDLQGGVVEIGHGGSNTGWQALFKLLPEKQAGLVLVTNSSNGSVFFHPTALTRAWYAFHEVACCPE